MADKKQAHRQDLDGILELAKAGSGVNVPENLDNEALLRVIALYYLAGYEETPRMNTDLWLFMKQPIPELYKSLFDVWVQNSKKPAKKGFHPLFNRTMSPNSIASTVEKYLDGKKATHAKDILVRYIRNALIDLYRN